MELEQSLFIEEHRSNRVLKIWKQPVNLFDAWVFLILLVLLLEFDSVGGVGENGR